MKFINSIVDYIKQSISELKKVTWPNKKQTTTYTIIVIVMSLGIAVFFGVLDYFFNFVLELVI